MRKIHARIDFAAAGLACCLLFVQAAAATEIIYRPVNPSFGGDPLNGPNLMSGANAQNHYTAPSALSPTSAYGATSLQQFTAMLQQSILSRVASAVSGSVVDAKGNLVPGTVTIGSISVTVLDLGTTLKITTLDTSSGQSNTFEVPK